MNTKTASSVRRAHGESARILVVDDEPEICRLLTDALETAGLEVSGAGSCAEAIEAAGKYRPDLVITDLRLGDSSGLEVIDRLRRDIDDLPVVVITGWPDPAALSEASRCRPVELLNKPLDLRRLCRVVHEELGRQRQRRLAHKRNQRLRELTRRISRGRKKAYRLACATCADLTAAQKKLLVRSDRQEAVIRYQRELLAKGDRHDVFRLLFRLFVNRTGHLFGAAMLSNEDAQLQLVGRFGVPVPDGTNFCRAIAGAMADEMLIRPEVTVLDAFENIRKFPPELHKYLVGVNVLAIPLMAEPGQLLGVVVLYRKGEQPFTEDDTALAEMIAAPTALAAQ